MAQPTLSAEQTKKAIIALLKYVGKEAQESKDLFDDDEMLCLVIALKKTPQHRGKDKPIRIAVPHSLYDVEGAEVCLIVKDHKGEGHKEAKKRVKQEELSRVAKVVGLSKLKTKYESHESKRQLCAAYDLFVADERIIPSLPKLLGKTFFKKKKQPVPVDLRGKDWAAQISAACAATYMFLSGGTSLSIRRAAETPYRSCGMVARTSFTEQQCMENVAAAVKGAIEHVPRKWKNVQALYLKTADSVALPIYQTMPDLPQRIGGLKSGGTDTKKAGKEIAVKA